MSGAFSGPQMILLGLSILVIGFLLWRTFSQNKRSRERDPSMEAREEIRHAEQSAQSNIRRLEVRLHNYGREVEGRVQTTLTLLDRLILEAEQETDHLQQALAAAGRPVPLDERDVRDSVGNELTPEDCLMICDLKAAGYGLPQIARLLRTTEYAVETALANIDSADDNRADAA